MEQDERLRIEVGGGGGCMDALNSRVLGFATCFGVKDPVPSTRLGAKDPVPSEVFKRGFRTGSN